MEVMVGRPRKYDTLEAREAAIRENKRRYYRRHPEKYQGRELKKARERRMSGVYVVFCTSSGTACSACEVHDAYSDSAPRAVLGASRYLYARCYHLRKKLAQEHGGQWDYRYLLLCDEPERFVGACREAVRDEYDLNEDTILCQN